jgi:hypothetical protein
VIALRVLASASTKNFRDNTMNFLN